MNDMAQGGHQSNAAGQCLLSQSADLRRAFAVAHFLNEIVLPAPTAIARLGHAKQNVVVEATLGARSEGVDLARVGVVVRVVAQHFEPFALEVGRLKVGQGRRRVVVEGGRVLRRDNQWKISVGR